MVVSVSEVQATCMNYLWRTLLGEHHAEGGGGIEVLTLNKVYPMPGAYGRYRRGF